MTSKLFGQVSIDSERFDVSFGHHTNQQYYFDVLIIFTGLFAKPQETVFPFGPSRPLGACSSVQSIEQYVVTKNKIISL